MVDYNDYILDQYYDNQEKYEEIARKMLKEGLNPSEPDDYDKYINELAGNMDEPDWLSDGY